MKPKKAHPCTSARCMSHNARISVGGFPKKGHDFTVIIQLFVAFNGL